jgi:2-dehydro-3-deoxygluconokinase
MIDVLAFGEALLRIQPEDGRRVEEAERFRAWPGGAELNTCCALAGLGLGTSFFTLLPESFLGRRILRHLRAHAVDTSLVRSGPGRLGTYWVEYGRKPRSIEVLYDRQGSSVCQVKPEQAPWEALAQARAFFVSGITLALSPQARSLAFELAARARAAGALVATDLNYRARLWSPAEAVPELERLARSAQVVVATEDDLRGLWGFEGDAERVARAARERFECDFLAMTCGGRGALSVSADGLRQVEAFEVEAIDRVGAGDAFSAGLLYALLSGRQPRALDYALALAGLKHSLPGDSLSVSPEELERLVSRPTHDIRR